MTVRFRGCAADTLREAGVAHVVYWEAAQLRAQPDALAVAHFGHAFFATLRNRSATVPEVSLFVDYETWESPQCCHPGRPNAFLVDSSAGPWWAPVMVCSFGHRGLSSSCRHPRMAAMLHEGMRSRRQGGS